MYLDFLADWDAGYSWGSAGLAYLYRSLDDATQRTEEKSGMCGCACALSIWMWERIPVGRPEKLKPREWKDYGEDDDGTRCPTVAYAWDVVGVYSGTSKALYKVFTNEFDALTAFQVNWQPYDERDWGFELNVMCTRDRLFWRCKVPMICVYAVEYHMPHRVAAQFGKVQRTPPDNRMDTSCLDLHLMSRQKNQSIVNWGETHEKYVKEWNEWKCWKDTERRVIDWNDFEDHLRWYDDGTKHRLRLRPQWTTADAEELYDDCSENEAYNESIRELNSGFREYAPLMNRSSELNKSIFEGSDVLSSIPGTRDSETKLSATVKKFVKKCRNLVGLLGCATSSAMADDDEEEEEEEHCEAQAEQDEEEEDDEEQAEEIEEEQSDDEEEYDDDDGPPLTQTTQLELEKRNKPKKDWSSPSPFQRARPPQRKKTGLETRSKHNEDRTSKRGRSK